MVGTIKIHSQAKYRHTTAGVNEIHRALFCMGLWERIRLTFYGFCPIMGIGSDRYG